MADNNIDVFKMFATEDRLDGDNYPMWAYMMQYVFVSKGIWNIMQGIDVRPGSMDVAKVVDVAGYYFLHFSTSSALYLANSSQILSSERCLRPWKRRSSCRVYRKAGCWRQSLFIATLSPGSPSQCSPRLLSSPPAQKFHVLSLARLQAEFPKPDPEGEPLGESSLTDIRRVLGAPVERLRESWNQVSELSREQGEVTRRRVLGAPMFMSLACLFGNSTRNAHALSRAFIDRSKEPSKPFDVTDKRLQDAATTFQNALNATTVVEEERFWTEVIVKYRSLEAEWVADIVSRAYGNRGNARRKAGRGVRRLRQVNHACSVGKEDDLFAIYFYSTELGCYNRTSIMYAVDPVLNRGVVLESLGRYDEASADYVAVLRAQPKDPAAWNNIGNVKAAQNRWEDALIGYAKAVELAPSFSFAAANYALELYQVGRVNEAVKQFRSLLRKYPEFPDMRAALAVSLYAEGLTAEAESNWERLEDRRYRDRAWVKNTRRWPPRLVNVLEAFLDVRSSRGSGA
ncbi:hypothetical protein L7F22_007751 [Adiantum nelumboides]|nr:hypothetical protein [Adiantum nelumboides]